MVDRKFNGAKAPSASATNRSVRSCLLRPSLPSILVWTSTQGGLRLMGGDGLPHLALFGAYIGLAGSVRRRQAEPGESRARQLNGTATGGQGEKTDEGSRSGDSNHADSVTNKRGQNLKASETACGDQDRIAARIW